MAIPYVSSLPAHDADLVRAAEWLVGKLQNIECRQQKLVPIPGPLIPETFAWHIIVRARE